MIRINSAGKLDLSILRPDQRQFVKSNALHAGIVGGYQSGKSLSAAIKVITKLLINPGVPIAYYLPTYSLIADMLIPRFKSLFDDIGMQYKVLQKESKIITKYGEIWMRSMDNPDSIVSYSVGYSVVDEVDVVHVNKRDAAMKRISSRNSYKKDTKNCMDFVSTPEGFGYMYTFFVKEANENKKLYRISTLDNAANLGEGYIDGLRGQYDEGQLRAYLHGEFVNLTAGSVYKDYNRKECHTNREIQPNEKLHIGLDFNITKMAAVVHVIENGKYYAVDELVNVYDTETMIRLIKDKYSGHYISIYPDASGRSRNSSGKSDIQLLMEAGFNINAPGKNPFIRDRVNAVNGAFRNKQYFVNVFQCPEYAAALEQIAYKNGEPDKTSGLDHVCDAGGYFIYVVSRVNFTV